MMIRKILLLGNIGVGKSSISQRLMFDRFSGDYKMTLGSEVHRYTLPPDPEAPDFQFLVVDTDGNFGQAIFRETITSGAQGAMVVGDLTRRSTLDAMVTLAEGFQDAFPGRYTALVLNKLDLLDSSGRADLPAKVQKPEFPVFKTSAKSGDNIKEAFHEAARTIVRRGL
jgi:Ras-related protein Rab-5C